MNRNPLRAAGIALLGLNLLAAAETPQAALLVLAKTDHTLSIVDPRTQKVTGHVPSGPDPHEVIASEDGRSCLHLKLRRRHLQHHHAGRLIKAGSASAHRPWCSSRPARVNLCRGQAMVYGRGRESRRQL